MQLTSKTTRFMFTTLLLINIILIGFLSYFIMKDNTSEELEVTRINFKNKSGNNRVVISNENKMPSPIINGKEYQRKIQPAGLIFYDENGDERGGIAVSENEKTNINAIAFDYQNADAIGIFAQDNKQDGYFKAGLTINDKDLSGKPGNNINRITLETENGNASLIIKDAQEIPRIVLSVDSIGNSSIEMFDKNGERTKSL